MSQPPREPSQRSKKPKHIDTDPETQLARNICYEYRDAKFVFACKRQIVSTSLDSDVWPIGTTYDFKTNLKIADYTEIILPKGSETARFLGKGPAKEMSAFKNEQQARLKSGKDVMLFVEQPNEQAPV